MGLITTDLTMPKVGSDTTRGQANAIVEMMAGNKGPNMSFYDWRQRNPVVAPDRGFVKQLKKIDPEFEVVWDFGSTRWEIWKIPRDQKGWHVLTVETQDKSYRQLGADILLEMQKLVGWRESGFDVVEYLIELDKQDRRRKEKDFRNKIEAITLDNFDWMRGVLKVSVPIKLEKPKNIALQEVVKND